MRTERMPTHPHLRLVRTEEDAVRDALARAIDEGRDDDARALLARLRRMAR